MVFNLNSIEVLSCRIDRYAFVRSMSQCEHGCALTLAISIASVSSYFNDFAPGGLKGDLLTRHCGVYEYYFTSYAESPRNLLTYSFFYIYEFIFLKGVTEMKINEPLLNVEKECHCIFLFQDTNNFRNFNL